MKLLLVEDDKKIATAVARGLEGEGFTVEVAYDGIDGLWHATEAAYDLIVLDIMLPGRNGYQVCAELREAGNWTPILMLTAKDAISTRPRRSTPGPTTTSPNPSRSPCWWRACARCCGAAAGAPRRR